MPAPPVGERISPLFLTEPDFELTKVMRFDNQILKLANRLREYVHQPFQNLDMKPDNDGVEGIWRVTKPHFHKQMAERAEGFREGRFKAIAWRNVVVDTMNQQIRAALPDRDFTLPWSKGDRIMAREPCFGPDKEVLMHTDDECEVVETVVAPHPMYPAYECFITTLKTDAGKDVSVWTITPNSRPFVEAELKELAEHARRDGKKWRDYWYLKESFHTVSLAYAITAHRSQGSTYEAAFVDFVDVLSNREKSDAARCLYVACSRPSKRLILGG